MAENKKSFILYADLIKSIDHLTNEEIGILFRHLFDYVNDKDPILTDRLLLTAWKPIELQLKRDLIKWDIYREKQAENGKLGGRPPKQPAETQTQINPNNPSLLLETQKSLNANVTATAIVNANENVIVTEIDSKAAKAAPPFSFEKSLLNYGFEKQLVSDWLKVRKTKRGTNTKTAFDDFIKTIEQLVFTGREKNDILRIMVKKSWVGLEVKWIENLENENKPVPVRKINEIGSNYDVTPKEDWQIGMTFDNSK